MLPRCIRRFLRRFDNRWPGRVDVARLRAEHDDPGHCIIDNVLLEAQDFREATLAAATGKPHHSAVLDTLADAIRTSGFNTLCDVQFAALGELFEISGS